MKATILAITASVTMLLLSVQTAFADKLLFKDGGELVGDVVEVTNEAVVFSYEYGTGSFPLEDVQKIITTDDLISHYEEQATSIEEEDAEAHYELGLWCVENGLETKAADEFEQAIDIDPDHEGARSELGYEKFDGEWVTHEEKMKATGHVLYEGKWVSAEDVEYLKAGLTRYKDHWYTKEELAELRKARQAERREDSAETGASSTFGSEEENPKAQLRELDQPLDMQLLKSRVNLATRKLQASFKNRIKNKYYSIYCDLDAKRTRSIARFTELFYRALDKTFNIQKEKQELTEIYIFETKEDFERFCVAIGFERGDHVGGFYNAGLQIVAVYDVDSGVFDVYKVLGHELTHQFIERISNVSPPLSIHEGLADYFGTVEMKGTKLSAGLVNEGRLREAQRAFRSGTYIPLRQLIQMNDPESFSSLAYAESWCFVYFFFKYDNGANVRYLGNYLLELQKGVEPVDAFKKVFAIDFDKLERVWIDFILKQ